MLTPAVHGSSLLHAWAFSTVEKAHAVPAREAIRVVAVSLLAHIAKNRVSFVVRVNH